MHIDEEILEHLQAREEERQREIKLRTEGLERYVATSKEQLDVAYTLAARLRKERNKYRKAAIVSTTIALILFGVIAFTG